MALAALLTIVALSASISDAYVAEVEAWRAQRESRLKADDGWLTLAGLFWLREGVQTFGTDPVCDLVFPAGSAPARAGTLEHRDGETTVRVAPGVEATVDGRPVTAAVLAPDTSGAPHVVRLGRRLQFHVIERGGRFGVRLRDLEAPGRRRFEGLRWFPVRETYRVEARFVPYDPARRLEIPDVTGGVQRMSCPGYAEFRLNGRRLTLDAVLEEPEASELFFIFHDQTAGRESYPGGRFLYASRPEGGRLVLDFNRAYSPPCAYTPYATCPLPPRQNRLPVRIEAGEKSEGH